MDNEPISLSDLQNNDNYDFLSQLYSNNSDIDNFNQILDEEPASLTYNEFNINCTYFDEQEFVSKYENNKNFSFLSWNIQSLPSKFNEFKDSLDFYRSSGFLFDVIALQEIWNIQDPDLFKLDGYNFVFKQRSNGSGGGVGIYVQESIKFKLLPQYTIFLDRIIETLSIELELKSNRRLIITSLYRPNTHPTITSSQQLNQFTDEFSNLLAELSSSNKDSLIMGDFNIDLLKFQSHEKTSIFVENCFANGFIQIITKPTRVTNGSATLIDHLYTNCIRNKFESGIITSRVSDHFPVFYFMNNVEKKKSPEFIYTRNFTDNNIEQFNNMLSSLGWGNVLNDNHVQSSYDNFSNTFNDLFDMFFPLRKVKFNKNVHKKSPFMTRGLLISRQTKFRLSKLSIEQPSILNTEKFKQYKKLYNKVIIAAKKNYYEVELEVNKKNLRKTWQILREATRKLNDKSSIIDQIMVDDVLIEDQEEICSSFNDYFTNVAEKIAEKINPSDRPPDSYIINSNSNFSMGHVDPFYLIELVSEMKSKKSTDIHGLSNSFVKRTIQHIALPLSHIFSLSLTQGIIPDQLKEAKVIPIFKLKNKKADEDLYLSNYRPISLLPILSKLLEKVVAKNLMSYLINNDLIYKHQYGFQPHKSTFHPMIHILKKVTDSVNNNEVTIGVFCDLQKAFDLCSHSILLRKLEKFGIKNQELEWFRSYLTNRKQFVSLNGKQSHKQTITKGVPQGSILGPILFLIYINDLASCTTLFTLLFADDTSFLISGKNLNEIIPILNVELHKVCDWFRANQLSLHPEKTKFMIFTNNEKSIKWEELNINLNYNNQGENNPDLIKKLGFINSESEVPAIKFLGVFLDPKLNFRYHIDSIRKKISKSLFVIKSAKNILNQNSLKTLYYAMVHCHLQYCVEIWSCCNPSLLNPLILQQKKAIRIINNAKYNAHTAPLFKYSRILPLVKIAEMSKLQIMFDFCINKLPSSFTNMWIRNYERPGLLFLRNNADFYVPFSRLKSIENFPNSAYPRLWNTLETTSPQLLNIDQSRNMFRKNLKEYLLDSLYITCTRPNCSFCV